MNPKVKHTNCCAECLSAYIFCCCCLFIFKKFFNWNFCVSKEGDGKRKLSLEQGLCVCVCVMANSDSMVEQPILS